MLDWCAFGVWEARLKEEEIFTSSEEGDAQRREEEEFPL